MHHVDRQRYLPWRSFAHSLIACGAMACAYVASSAVAATSMTRSPLTANESSKVRSVIAPALEKSLLFQGMRVQSVKLMAAEWVIRMGQRELLASAVVTFESVSNRYCGAMIVDATLGGAKLIEGPAPIEDCRRIDATAFVDINGDGAAIAQHIVVASNRDGSDAAFFAVYLPEEQGTGYCYSSQASERLYSDYPFDARNLKAALDAARVKLKVGRYGCGPG